MSWKFTTHESFYQSASLKVTSKTGHNSNHLFIYFLISKRTIKGLGLGSVFIIIIFKDKEKDRELFFLSLLFKPRASMTSCNVPSCTRDLGMYRRSPVVEKDTDSSTTPA